MVRSSLSVYLRTKGYHVDDVALGFEAMDKVASDEFNVVLLDMQLPDIYGMDVLKEILKLSPRTKVIIGTGSLNQAEKIL